METLELESKVSLKDAYLVMFEYLNQYWEETGKPDEIGSLLGELSLWDSAEGKVPMDSSVLPQWLNCAQLVVEKKQTNEGYTKADIKLFKK